MAVYLRIDDVDGLRLVNDLIHDAFFEVSDVQFDPETSTVTIPFKMARVDGNWWKFLVSTATSAPDITGRVTVREVESMSMTDTEKVGSYDFNKLTYESDSRRLVVLTGIPLALEFLVNAVDVSVEVRRRWCLPR